MLRRGLSPLAVTISTATAAPVLAGVRLQAGSAGSARGAASLLTEAVNTAKAAGATAENILVRGDSAYGNGKVITAVVKTGARFSLTLARTDPVIAAINTIPDEAYTPVRYPGAVVDPDTGALISDAQVAEVPYTAVTGTDHEITARLVVRRVADANTQDPLFPVWRHHPFLTNSTEPVVQADLTHRQHAICETVWSDLIDGPWAHRPSGWFPANAAWCLLAAICHNRPAAGLALSSMAGPSWTAHAACSRRHTSVPTRQIRLRKGCSSSGRAASRGAPVRLQ